jgi:hypothetical protein
MRLEHVCVTATVCRLAANPAQYGPSEIILAVAVAAAKLALDHPVLPTDCILILAKPKACFLEGF